MTKEEEFIESLYDEAEEQIKEVYKEQKENRDKLLQELASIMLTYTISKGLMSLVSKDELRNIIRSANLIMKAIQGEGATQRKVIKDILTSTVNKTFNHYSYNADLKDIRKIIENNFKGKHFSGRVWRNKEDVASG